MLRVEDCIALCELTEDEVAAIAEHEHVPAIIAAEMASYLIQLPDGEARLKRIILDDIDTAMARGDYRHAGKLRLVLRHFVELHRDAADIPPAAD